MIGLTVHRAYKVGVDYSKVIITEGVPRATTLFPPVSESEQIASLRGHLPRNLSCAISTFFPQMNPSTTHHVLLKEQWTQCTREVITGTCPGNIMLQRYDEIKPMVK